MNKEQLEEAAKKESSLHFNKDYFPDHWQGCVTGFIAGYSLKEGAGRMGEWQLCPKCNGGGMAMNMGNLIPTTMDLCDVCGGSKILSRPIIKQEL